MKNTHHAAPTGEVKTTLNAPAETKQFVFNRGSNKSLAEFLDEVRIHIAAKEQG